MIPGVCWDQGVVLFARMPAGLEVLHLPVKTTVSTIGTVQFILTPLTLHDQITAQVSKGSLGDTDSCLPRPVDVVDSRSTFAEACAQRRPPDGPDDDPVVMRRSRQLTEFRRINNK
ncbi:hypothetical protein ACOMHN_047451 [Nucella lapillus]